MNIYETAHEAAVRLTNNGENCVMGKCIDCPMAKARRVKDGCLVQAYVNIKDVNEQERAFNDWRAKNPFKANYDGELKPCPFCGGEAQMDRFENCAYVVRCKNLKCPAARTMNYNETMQKAAKRWNDRV